MNAVAQIDPPVAHAPAASPLTAAIAGACARIAPLWSLRHFVAVNPFLGFAGQGFADTCATLRRVVRADMLMPRGFYRQALADGTIQDDDLAAALRQARPDWGVPQTPAALRAAVMAESAAGGAPPAVVATVAEVLDRLAQGDRQTSRTGFMIDEISKWCAAYFDEGQAVWRMPSRSLPLYAAWRADMRHDLNPEAMGIAGFRAAVAEMPDDPVAAIAAVCADLGIPERALEDYLYRALFDIGGWAAYVRQRVWNNDLHGRTDDTLVHLLAVRVVWGYAIFRQRRDAAFRAAWAEAMRAAALAPTDSSLGHDRDLAIDLTMQLAYEAAWQRRFLQRFGAVPAASAASRPAVQAAFCIDVRSEVYRRALETVCDGVETIGFAGFFGFPIEYVPIGRRRGGAQCPVLLKPAFTVCEAIDGASPAEATRALDLRLLRRRVGKAWKAFKRSAISSFAYVEAVGLLFAGKLVGDSLGLTRPVPDPVTEGLDTDLLHRIAPSIEAGDQDGRPTGFTDPQRVAMAAAVLKAMSLTAGFARLVLLVGHGSATVNNPHASGLDCGACGGHTGEANARVAAAILNDPRVRRGLAEQGIAIPEDTWFLPALHDTTTDAVRVFDTGRLPAGHRDDLDRLRAALDRASALARAERAPALGVAGGDAAAAILGRARDWSQVRPEWGLAGNAAFIAAPRRLTAERDLGGRAFLHSYDWKADTDFSVLRLIMTAPMVVASWINLQYYGSTVNNRAFGAGNKTLHNVAGGIGVLEGNAGDLRTGLPWQSVHDGTRFVHEPLRLSVVLAAPVAAINDVIASQKMVRDLVDNGWLHLFAMDDAGQITARYAGGLTWGAP